jgi:hypothetical protein
MMVPGSEEEEKYIKFLMEKYKNKKKENKN